MPSVILECPHCGAEKIGFKLVTDLIPTNWPPGFYGARSVMVCSGCEEVVIGLFQKPGTAGQPIAPMKCDSDPRQHRFMLIKTYPQAPQSRCPNHTPDALKRIFLQAANALKRGDADASGAMSRKVVDVSTQMLLGGEAKKYANIYQRIEALAAKNVLTPDLKDWAHEVRLGGADAAHDLDPFTEAEADELLDFAELYLTYVYSLPERLKQRREKAAAEKQKAQPQSAPPN